MLAVAQPAQMLSSLSTSYKANYSTTLSAGTADRGLLADRLERKKQEKAGNVPFHNTDQETGEEDRRRLGFKSETV